MTTYIRFAIVIVTVALVDGAWVLTARHPLPLAAILPATIPLWVSLFVIIPMRKRANLPAMPADSAR